MDRRALHKAAKLLAKAQETTFDPEAAALAEKAYRLLAEFLNEVERETAPGGASRRRERRHLRDRRSPRRLFGRGSEPRADPATTYRRSTDPTDPAPGEGINLRA
jgi:hypothetical protein